MSDEELHYRWVWVFGILLTLAFIAFLSYLAGLMPKAMKYEDNYGTPKFTYYKELAERSITPLKERAVKAASFVSEGTRIESDTTVDRSVAVLAEPVTLQAGSFKNKKDADQRRAELAMLSLESQIKKVRLDSGQVRYRVMLGPFQTAGSLSTARAILSLNAVDYLQVSKRG